jgi:hypothetical protein
MSAIRKRGWKPVYLLYLAFAAVLIHITGSNLTDEQQTFWLLLAVVVFYGLLGIMVNAQWMPAEARYSEEQPVIRYWIHSPVMKVDGQVRPCTQTRRHP